MNEHLNPLNKLRFIKAFLDLSSDVTLLDGQVFNLTYESHEWYPLTNGTRIYAFFEPQRNEHRAIVPLPRGYIDLTIALNSSGEWFDR